MKKLYVAVCVCFVNNKTTRDRNVSKNGYLTIKVFKWKRKRNKLYILYNEEFFFLHPRKKV